MGIRDLKKYIWDQQKKLEDIDKRLDSGVAVSKTELDTLLEGYTEFIIQLKTAAAQAPFGKKQITKLYNSYGELVERITSDINDRTKFTLVDDMYKRIFVVDSHE